MNKNIDITKEDSVNITNLICGDITVTLGKDGIYIIKGLPNARFTIVNKCTGSETEECVIVRNNTIDISKEDQVKKPKYGIEQTAFSNLYIEGDFVGNVTQSIGF